MSTEIHTGENGNGVVSARALRAQSRQRITNPDTGNSYLVRRPSLAALIRAGVLPENYVSRTLFGPQKKRDPDDKMILESEEVQEVIVTAAMLEPRVVAGADPEADDEIEYADIPPSDASFINLWATGRDKSRAVEFTGGEVTTRGELDNFPAGERLGEPAGALRGDEPVRDAGE